MTTSDENQSQGDEHAADAATASQAEPGGAERAARHGRRRRGGGRPPEQQRQPQSQQRRTETGLNMDELRELTELFTTHALTDFEFENADIRIRLSRNPAPTSATAAAPVVGSAAAHNPVAAMHASAHAATTAESTSHPATAADAAPPEEEMHVITSPIVGTFYRSPSPAAESFVKVGSHVEHDSVVCIIEAMKLMNEIQAETSGTIAKIYVENGQPVEYGQPLFGVKK
ncbi:MAG: acetyl-CoA carboxylase biotin carboxyl carrier protein [Acidobacteriota bacterium]|jgi:acetyl-CoA carboxylase biotin carboxyl carrier protein|nr:acetyl-CoA carboxylase biotin carboxyl carrier protein [Acidobacteriota bacterium]